MSEIRIKCPECNARLLISYDQDDEVTIMPVRCSRDLLDAYSYSSANPSCGAEFIVEIDTKPKVEIFTKHGGKHAKS